MFATPTLLLVDDDATIAAAAGVPSIVVASFRAGIPHWGLERPGVLRDLAKAMGFNEDEARANFSRSKAATFTPRMQAGTAPTTFGGAFPSIRT